MLFLRFASILVVAGALVVAADGLPEFAPPETLASSDDSDTPLRPFAGGPVRTDGALDDTKVIRGLLMKAVKRQACPGGYGLCNGGGWVLFLCFKCSWFGLLMWLRDG
jgi:hypothetical protein